MDQVNSQLFIKYPNILNIINIIIIIHFEVFTIAEINCFSQLKGYSYNFDFLVDSKVYL